MAAVEYRCLRCTFQTHTKSHLTKDQSCPQCGSNRIEVEWIEGHDLPDERELDGFYDREDDDEDITF